MFSMAPFDDDPLCLSPSIPRRRALVPLHRVLASLLLCLLLGTDILQGWPLALPTAHAAALPTPTPPTMTLQIPVPKDKRRPSASLFSLSLNLTAHSRGQSRQQAAGPTAQRRTRQNADGFAGCG